MIAHDLIKKIRKIEIFTNRLVNDQLAGQYHSVFKGRGMAFEEVRQYQPGDDIRLIDWNVSARMRDIYIKLFVEEREMTVMLLVDMSASGLFGTAAQTKREIAAEMAAVVAFSAIKNNDRVGLIIFTDRVEKFVPPKKGKKHVLRVVSEILSYQPQQTGTNIAAGLEFLGRVSKRRSIAFLLSDFISDIPGDQQPEVAKHALPKEAEHALKVVARKHDLIPVTISDPLEASLPEAGFINLVDYETGEILSFDTQGPEASQYAAFMKAAAEYRRSLFKKMKIDAVEVHTDENYLPALLNFFRARERRMRRG